MCILPQKKQLQFFRHSPCISQSKKELTLGICNHHFFPILFSISINILTSLVESPASVPTNSNRWHGDLLVSSSIHNHFRVSNRNSPIPIFNCPSLLRPACARGCPLQDLCTKNVPDEACSIERRHHNDSFSVIHEFYSIHTTQTLT